MVVYVNKWEYDVVTEDRFNEMVKEATEDRINDDPDFWDDCYEEAANAEYEFPSELMADIDLRGLQVVSDTIDGIAYDIATDRVREDLEDGWVERNVWEVENA